MSAFVIQHLATSIGILRRQTPINVTAKSETPKIYLRMTRSRSRSVICAQSMLRLWSIHE